MNGLKADLLKRGNMLVQSNRSFTELKLNQIDVWDSKHFFSQKIREFILLENFNYRSMTELQDAILLHTKNFIKNEQISATSVEGPWKAYVLRK